jgi:hypothetical protein
MGVARGLLRSILIFDAGRNEVARDDVALDNTSQLIGGVKPRHDRPTWSPGRSKLKTDDALDECCAQALGFTNRKRQPFDLN